MKAWILLLFLLSQSASGAWFKLGARAQRAEKCRSRLSQSEPSAEGTLDPPSPYSGSGDLGKGTIGIVSSIYDPVGKHWIAEKEFIDPRMKDYEWVNIVRAEELAKHLSEKYGADSPVVQIYSVERQGSKFKTRMELLQGPTVRKYLADLFKNGFDKSSVKEALSLLAKVSEAAGILEKENILHTDFKTENVMVTKKADGSVAVKVIDPESLMALNPTTKALTALPTYIYNKASPELQTLHDYKTVHDAIPYDQHEIEQRAAKVGAASMRYDIGVAIEKQILNPSDTAKPKDASVLKVGSSRVDLQACKLEYSIVSPK